MRIAINTLGPGSVKVGIGNYVVNLVKELAEIDKTNEYFILANKTNAHFFRVNNKNFKIVVTPTYTKIKPLRILWEQLVLPFTLKRMNVDILHSPGFVAPFIKTTKSVVTIHDMTFFSHPQYHTKGKVLYFKTFIPHSIHRADTVSADSESTRQDILKYVTTDASKITTIHLGVSELFKRINKQEAKKALATKYNIKDPFILFVGMIEPRKNLKRLVKAFAQLNPEIKLVIVGKKGWKTESLFRLIKKKNLSNKIVFPGFVPDEDLVLFYNAAECFAYPSLYEGFGIPVLEAMACGCPVITSNNSSLKETSEGAALLVDPKDVDRIREAINVVLTNKKRKQQLINAGLKRARKFSWRNTAEKTLELYLKCL